MFAFDRRVLGFEKRRDDDGRTGLRVQRGVVEVVDYILDGLYSPIPVSSQPASQLPIPNGLFLFWGGARGRTVTFCNCLRRRIGGP